MTIMRANEIYELPKQWQELEAIYNNDSKIIELFQNVKSLYQQKSLSPNEVDLFNAFKLSDPKNIKVVILGEEPYPRLIDAHGLAFSSNASKIPASLRNIFKVIKEDYPETVHNSFNLEKWALQGVFLYNTILTIDEGKSHSHDKLGWNYFTEYVLKYISQIEPLVVVLWGNKAHTYEKYFNNSKQLIIKTSHPSPLSAYRNFYGLQTFKKINSFLANNNQSEIDWST